MLKKYSTQLTPILIEKRSKDDDTKLKNIAQSEEAKKSVQLSNTTTNDSENIEEQDNSGSPTACSEFYGQEDKIRPRPLY